MDKKIKAVKEPIANRKPELLSLHGDDRMDDYYWLNERENPEVIDYLNEENAYYRARTAHTQPFQQDLFDEMKSRIKEDDSSVPYLKNGFYYTTRYEQGKEYPIHSRKLGHLDANEEILFDCNTLAKGHDYFRLSGIAISPDNRMAAFGVDTVSRRQYTIQIKDLDNGTIFEDKITDTTGSAPWADDNRSLFYVKKDPVTLRADKVYKHRLGTPESEDELVYHETDTAYNVFVYRCKSRKYIVIGSVSTLTSEYRFLPADIPDGDFKVFAPRQRGVEYSIYHYGTHFYVLTNKDGATNFKLMQVEEGDTAASGWKEFIPHRETVLLEDIDIFKDYYVLTERQQGLNTLRIVRWDGSQDYYMPFDSETYVAGPTTNLEFDTTKFRYYYNAMTAPFAIIEYDLDSRTHEILKEQEVLGGQFDKDNYRSKRLWATAEDGIKVPISIVYHKDTEHHGNSPLLLYAYGSYGSTIDPYFSSVRLSLLDRGFSFAIAHVRGGEYLGRSWYDDGKLLTKRNTFTDFIACSEYLVAEGVADAKRLYAMGGSAGGLLIGAVVNMRPELYHGAIAAVPFVDVVTTMLDDSIPLTTGEYDEWGNPNEKTYYEYMKSYSPYDNVKAQDYPNMYVSTGLHDSQVQYWEPAKWVAKLRRFKTDTNALYLDTNMEAGHGGASGRFEALKETAKEYAFLLDLAGKG